MEKVSIREASIRLRLSQASVRRCISEGELKAYRETGPNGRPAWVVELPEEGWTSSETAAEEDRKVFPWWWADVGRTGQIHYVEELNISAFEEMIPKFLCGFDGANVWVVNNLDPDALCSDCLELAKERGLPLALDDQQHEA